MELSQLATPVLLLDEATLRRNGATMRARAAALKVALRPNIKTHKSVEVAALLLCDALDASPPQLALMRVATSTLSETRHFLEAGFGDVLYAVPLAGSPKVALAADLARRFDARVSFMIDTLDGVAALRDCGTELSVWVKVDCGYGRAGRQGAALTAVVDAVVAAQNLRLRGLYCHAGHSYHVDGTPLEAKAAAEVRAMCQAAAAAGRPLGELSVGATPTASAPCADYGAVTEMHPGCYALYDVMQCQIGSCAVSDVAVSVLCTVLGVYPERNSALVDVGSRALGKDALELPSDSPWGVFLGRPDLQLVSISQEVGVVRGAVETLRVGQQLRVLPNHACICATNFDEYHLINADQRVVRVLKPTPRGFN